MRILIAGGTGAIGRPLLPMLTSAGHEVTALTRSPDRAEWIEQTGAASVVCDVRDADAVSTAVTSAEPDLVIDLLTSLPQDFNPRKANAAYRENDAIRRDGTGALIAAAEQADVDRYIVQSVAFQYAPVGPPVVDEEAPPWVDAPKPFDESVAVLVANEQKVTRSNVFAGTVLRYGFLYGPGTWYETGGSSLEQLRKRQFPIVGDGGGVSSLVHVHDAATATLAAVEAGDRAAGIFNVVDDDPAPMSELVPELAEILGYKQPRHVPTWLASLLAGRYLALTATELRGASNAKARDVLGWKPAITSWREGFLRYRDSFPD
ncbi:MAG: NAD-dependent epimerase/dehydratase family protein [Solirubrobacterales bacterium]